MVVLGVRCSSAVAFPSLRCFVNGFDNERDRVTPAAGRDCANDSQLMRLQLSKIKIAQN